MLKLDKAAVDSSIGNLQKAFNGDTLEVFASLAGVLREEEANGGNPIITQTLEACKKFQAQYNVCLESFRGLCKDAEGVAEIAEYVNKVQMGDVTTRDTSFATQGINADDVRM
jgi:hypothetical protein